MKNADKKKYVSAAITGLSLRVPDVIALSLDDPSDPSIDDGFKEE